MEYEISGTTMQAVELTMQRGESVFTETGGMAWMRGRLNMTTNMPGGLMGGLKRKFSGESFFLTTYTAEEDNCKITFTPYAPGKVYRIQLDGQKELILQKDAFMLAESTVNLALFFQRRLGSALFGGEGFVMQKISGRGLAFAEIPGEIVEINLAPGEEVRVDPGHVAMFEPSVSFDIERIKGVSNILFGGEGLFLSSLRGPGWVALQTMTLQNLAAKIAAHIPKSRTAGGGD